ncbi:MAG: HDOD domain-containing protein [Methylococcaceae bacterium]|nr:HDOD domain-containing protein [Methylococcaceae bacterium]
MADFIIGRQQIFDQKLNIFAYELLFRGNEFDLNNKNEATQATNQIITDSILELGLNNLVGSHKAFINFTTQNILEKTPLSLPKDRVVIEVLENVAVDLRIINNLREFSQQGYTIALDDFIFSDEWKPLIEFIDIIKLDILAMGETKTRSAIQQLKSYKVRLLAEKVETHEEFQYLRELGCDYFQGFFFNKPNTVVGKRLGVNQTAAIRLLTIINDSDVEIDDLAKIISQDVGLSYKLLHYINSAFFALPSKVGSIHHAISYLGLKEIKRWSNILTLASLSNKSEAILQNALIRGKMCEQLGKLVGEKSDHFFLIGILSCLDSLLDIPIEEALQQLPLADDIMPAILFKQGLTGEALACVINYEHWNISELTFRDLDQKLIGEAYVESINWAKDVLSNLN